MATGLAVREPFGGYAVGTVIFDQAKVAEILAGPHASSVAKFSSVAGDVAAPDPAHEEKQGA